MLIIGRRDGGGAGSEEGCSLSAERAELAVTTRSAAHAGLQSQNAASGSR